MDAMEGLITFEGDGQISEAGGGGGVQDGDSQLEHRTEPLHLLVTYTWA